MSARLSATQLDTYRRTGFLSPVTALEKSEIADRYAWLQALERERAGRLPPLLNFKPHLLVPWLWELIQSPQVVDAVEELLGPDILCWEASFFSKEPGDKAHVTWHQDATYWGLTGHDALTAWIAFTPSVLGNGCMRVLPGSHRAELAHVKVADRSNLLPIGENVAMEIDHRDTCAVILQPGEMSMHHPLLVHGSGANRSTERRVGFAIRYISGHLSQRGERHGTATLVRGKDHGHFDLEQAPEAEFCPAARARHRDLLRRWMNIVTAEARGES